jgi:hypothetical protein
VTPAGPDASISERTGAPEGMRIGQHDQAIGLAAGLTAKVGICADDASALIDEPAELGDNAPQPIAVGEPLAADFERVLGPDHRSTLASRDNLASAYQAAGRAAEAIPAVRADPDRQ